MEIFAIRDVDVGSSLLLKIPSDKTHSNHSVSRQNQLIQI